MEKIIVKDRITTSLVGCAVLIVGSLIRVPFYPVPFTLQTLSLFIIGLLESPKRAFYSVLVYLSLATLGVPVFGYSDPLWIAGKCGGYLISFPIAAYVVASLRRKWGAYLATITGQLIIYFCGFLWLAPFVGTKAAFYHGVLLFIPSAAIKIMLACHFARLWRSI